MDDYGSAELQIRAVWAACVLWLENPDNAEILDAGTPATHGKGRAGAHWVECGTRAGYLREKITTLRALCERAMSTPATHLYFS